MHEYVHVVKAPPSVSTGLCRICPKLVVLVTSHGLSQVRLACLRPRPSGPASRRRPRPAQMSEDPFDAACSFNVFFVFCSVDGWHCRQNIGWRYRWGAKKKIFPPPLNGALGGRLYRL